MHVSGSGPLGVLLMIAPLAAIPVFAILGVPQFAPVTASGADDDDFAELGDASSRPPAITAPLPAQTRSANDLYAAVAEPSSQSAAASAATNQERRPSISTAPIGRSRGSSRWLPPSEALDQWEVRTNVSDTVSPTRKNQQADPPSVNIDDGFEGLEVPAEEADDGQVSADGFNPDLLKADRMNQSKKGARSAVDMPMELPAENIAQSPGEQSGWQDAARRLKQLGVRKCRLEPQIDEQRFVFICSMASPDNPRVVRRFEADADEPLAAVQQVIEQIDQWRNRGAAGQTEPLPDDEN